MARQGRLLFSLFLSGVTGENLPRRSGGRFSPEAAARERRRLSIGPKTP